MGFLSDYIDMVSLKNPALASAIEKTVADIVPQYISNFSYMEHVVSLLVGDVQSGKTSHMFGIMSAAADEGFANFILLTTDNIGLQQQTFKRATNDLKDFCVCDETEYIKFVENNMKKPSVIVLKKNTRVLKQWKNNLASTSFCAGNPLFIVDDEADAASLNTLVNKRKQSTINKNLEDIKKTTSSSIYMEVTGTPQSILLQTVQSGWKPYFIYYFQPGEKYLGGNFFFSQDNHPNIILTDDEEASEIISGDELPESYLKKAILTHLISSANILINGGSTSNFLIHPSQKIAQHKLFAGIVKKYLSELYENFTENSVKSALESEYKGLKANKGDLIDFENIYNYIGTMLNESRVKTLVLNSESDYIDAIEYENGCNIIVGGNSLGRGITFPMLQTVYYCRVAKSPQADTMWQHARMFGYDRESDLVRLYIPPKLYKLFRDINETNNSIISQIINRDRNGDIRLFYPTNLKPTRKNVIDNKTIGIFAGGVNYFPFEPSNKDIGKLDSMLSKFEEETYNVSLKFIIKVIEEIDAPENDWNSKLFAGFINTMVASNPIAQGKLVIRRNRNIAKGTGTLLSPTDRLLGESISDEVVLTMYKVTGEKGWNGQQLWIPNIKLPNQYVYYGEN